MMFVELHIKNFEYQNILKQQTNKQLSKLFLCMFLLAFSIESIGYNFKWLYYILFIIATLLLLSSFRALRLKKKKVLGFELIYIDENNRFFYNNLFIEMKDLQNYVIGKDEIILNFIDYMIVVEKDENLYDYLNRFVKNKKANLYKKSKIIYYCSNYSFCAFFTQFRKSAFRKNL